MKKNRYESPALLILQFEENDVVRTSGTGGDNYESDNFDELPLGK